jgi:hypothetical protein
MILVDMEETKNVKISLLSYYLKQQSSPFLNGMNHSSDLMLLSFVIADFANGRGELSISNFVRGST